eukprot:344564-Pelagomonas_calceolata.AAC.1
MLPARDTLCDMVIAEDSIACLHCAEYSSLVLLIAPNPLGTAHGRWHRQCLGLGSLWASCPQLVGSGWGPGVGPE